MANLPTSQGYLNLLASSVTIQNYPALNVTAAYLAKRSIRLAPEGDTTKYIEVLTGAVPSPQPYLMMTATMALTKTLSLAAAYQSQYQSSVYLGTVTIRPDVSRGSGGLQPFVLQNASLMTPGEMDFGGNEADFMVPIKGYWQISSQLWNGLVAAQT
jgi:hypothetical protein